HADSFGARGVGPGAWESGGEPSGNARDCAADRGGGKVGATGGPGLGGIPAGLFGATRADTSGGSFDETSAGGRIPVSATGPRTRSERAAENDGKRDERNRRVAVAREGRAPGDHNGGFRGPGQVSSG